jgi:hypothetical protein
MEKEKGIKPAQSKAKHKQNQIRKLATIEAAFHFLIDDERKIMEQYKILKKAEKNHPDDLAVDYVNPVEENEFDTTGELYGKIENMISSNIKFANRILRAK